MPRFNQILQSKFDFTEEDIESSRRQAAQKNESYASYLLRKNLLTEDQLLALHSEALDIPIIAQLPLENLDNRFTDKIPIHYLKKYAMVPLGSCQTDDGPSPGQASPCLIVMGDPGCVHQLDDLVHLLDIKQYDLALASRKAILNAINLAYDLKQDAAEQLVQDMENSDLENFVHFEVTADLLDETSDAPIIRLVNNIISQSAKARASDIHIEPSREQIKVRYRIDGVLYDLLTPPKHIQSALISRIKVMAKLDIAEKRLPQDGRFDVKIGNTEIDVRVSTIPTAAGERVVMRLLNKTSALLDITDLGVSANQMSQLKRLVAAPNGIILVTGPTGSGKTTSLYAVLSHINTPDINIITVEDPVEYQIDGINQIQVNPKIGLTFASGLRSIVRQDPDVILVGEIRDRETAEIAVQSALTGHMVYSTLHTNDSPSAITRLVDIGIEPFLISSSVNAVIAQRLVRMLCPDCREPGHYGPAAFSRIGLDAQAAAEGTIYQPKGCENCVQTGYRGRLGIFEFMIMSPTLKNLILEAFDAGAIKSQAIEEGMITLQQDANHKVLAGITSVDEAFRVTH
ncbi:MAG: type II secretion system ATPase GspE [Desulfobacterales bacterium]|jgi:general secretion pathway protein E